MVDEGFTEGLKSKAVPIGLLALIRKFDLRIPLPAVHSYAAPAARRTHIAGRMVREFYPPGYAPGDVAGHLRFAMRYEPVDLGVLAALFLTVERGLLEQWVQAEPTGKFARRAWYLYELLTGRTLDVPDVIATGYVDLLDERIHLTGDRIRVRRQRINDNLLGDGAYCPLIRCTETLEGWIAQGLGEEARAALKGFDPRILARAVNYLYTKETKSSFAIEGEAPGPERSRRFVGALSRVADFDTSDPRAFVHLQNAIVDPRYSEQGWRTTQNFVSQTMPDYTEHVHFICPKPEDVPGLMEGWMRTAERLSRSQADPVAAAAAVAFGFVFIHPFDDGNGRIHRYLVHQVLARSGFTPEGILFPVSAVMLRDRSAYDEVLEAYSSAMLPFIDWVTDDEQGVRVRNETAHLYRFFDATPFAEYLYGCVAETIRRDLREAIGFLSVFDEAVRKTMEVVDMPDRRASLLVRLILQNQGRLSAVKRASFAELTDEEVAAIEAAVGSCTGRRRAG